MPKTLDTNLWVWWLRREWKPFLLLFGLAALFVGLGLYLAGQIGQPPQAEKGVIVRFGTSHGYDGNSPIVLVRTDDGTVHQLGADSSTLFGCRRGDTIGLIRRGSVLTVDRAGCHRASR